jgi:uncharacterized protein (TIGR01777 family)
MTILITGATGLIGRPLTEALLEQGAQVRVITRRPHRVLEAFERYSSKVLAFEWHPRTEPFPPEALEGVERVIHLMGEPVYGPATRDARRRIVESRRIAATRLNAALGRQRVHLIVASSASVYGFGAGMEANEASELPRTRNKYALALRTAEETLAEIAANGSAVTMVRMGLVIAQGGFVEPLRQLHAAGFTWRATPPDAPVPMVIPAIDLVDAVSLLAWLARARRVSGPINAVAPEPLRSHDLKEILEDAVPRRLRVTLPHLALRHYIGSLADVVHSRQQVVPQRLLQEAGFVFERPHPNDSVAALLAEQAPAAPEEPAARPKRGSLLAGVLQKG